MNGDAPVATPSQTVGPFFHHGLPERALDAAGDHPEALRLVLVVRDGDAQPVEDALVEVWHAGGAARRAATRRDGSGEIAIAPPPAAAGRAASLNVCLFARGLLRQLHTRIYFEGDAALAGDPVYALVPNARRSTLLARRDPDDPARWRFEIRLQGPDETVFFAL